MTRKRTCTRRCWNAKCKHCRCTCEGINHGIWQRTMDSSQPDKYLDNEEG